MKRKIRQPILRLFRGVQFLNVESPEECYDLLDFIAGMGYLLYAEPDGVDSHLIVSSKRLTFGDYKKRHLGKDKESRKWWNEDTDYNDRLKEELEEFIW